MSIPLTEITLSISKPSMGSTIVLFSNQGEAPLSWRLSIATNAHNLPWLIFPPSGNLSQCGIGNITLHLAPETIQARAASYDSNFTLKSSSLVPATRSIPVVVHTIVSAEPSATLSIVTMRNAEAINASGTLMFDITPVDSTGLVILDPPDTSYQTLVAHSTESSESALCSVTYYVGECVMPRLATGEFYLEVKDSAGLQLVGSGQYSFSITRCPPTYRQGNGSKCVCDAGFYDLGASCAPCGDGSVSAAGADACTPCADPGTTSSLDHTVCGDCNEGYYRRTGPKGDDLGCVVCPDHVFCPARGRLQDWQLDAGFWRIHDDSSDVYVCAHGKVSCPGPEVDNAVCMDDQNDADKPHCACGYVGPLCSECADEYFATWGSKGCMTCADGGNHVSTIVVGLLAVVGAVIGLVVTFYNKQKIMKNARLKQALELYRIGSVKCRVLFFACQVISQFAKIWSATGDKDYPDPAGAFAGALGLSNLDFLSILPMGCMLPNANFYDRLLMKSLFPFVVLFLMWLWPLKNRIMTGSGVLTIHASRLTARNSLLLMELLLPSVSTTIAQVNRGGSRNHSV